jgi:hypothetical protein
MWQQEANWTLSLDSRLWAFGLGLGGLDAFIKTILDESGRDDFQ